VAKDGIAAAETKTPMPSPSPRQSVRLHCGSSAYSSAAGGNPSRWPLDEDDLAARSRPVCNVASIGDVAWMQRIVDRLNFGHALRREGWSMQEKREVAIHIAEHANDKCIERYVDSTAQQCIEYGIVRAARKWVAIFASGVSYRKSRIY